MTKTTHDLRTLIEREYSYIEFKVIEDEEIGQDRYDLYDIQDFITATKRIMEVVDELYLTCESERADFCFPKKKEVEYCIWIRQPNHLNNDISKYGLKIPNRCDIVFSYLEEYENMFERRRGEKNLYFQITGKKISACQDLYELKSPSKK